MRAAKLRTMDALRVTGLVKNGLRVMVLEPSLNWAGRPEYGGGPGTNSPKTMATPLSGSRSAMPAGDAGAPGSSSAGGERKLMRQRGGQRLEGPVVQCSQVPAAAGGVPSQWLTPQRSSEQPRKSRGGGGMRWAQASRSAVIRAVDTAGMPGNNLTNFDPTAYKLI